MSLTSEELRRLAKVLERIEAGLPSPRIEGHVGRYIRQYASAHKTVAAICSERGIRLRADGALSGRELGPAEAHPMLPLEVAILDFPLGEVAQAPAVTEELGGLVRLALWLKGPRANETYNLLRVGGGGARLVGDYRWTPLSRLTIGEAEPGPAEERLLWWHARCLKAVADDLNRPAHALEYVLDYQLGSPGLKHFRSLCARKAAGGWEILPALGSIASLNVVDREAAADIPEGKLACLLVYREPWAPKFWWVVEARRIDDHEAVAHSLTWLDFRLEIENRALDGRLVEGVRDSLRSAGVDAGDEGEPNLSRSLLPNVRELLRRVKGLD